MENNENENGQAGMGATLMLKRSISPDGKINALSVEVSCSIDGLSKAEIVDKGRAMRAIQRQLEREFAAETNGQRRPSTANSDQQQRAAANNYQSEHRQDDGATSRTAPVTAKMRAKMPGRCAECHGAIEAGEFISPMGDRGQGWRHAACPVARPEVRYEPGRVNGNGNGNGNGYYRQMPQRRTQ